MVDITKSDLLDKLVIVRRCHGSPRVPHLLDALIQEVSLANVITDYKQPGGFRVVTVDDYKVSS